MKWRNTRLLITIASVVLLFVVSAMVVSAGKFLNDLPPNLDAEYRGSDECQTCHNEAGLWDVWSATAHAWTIRPATEETVSGALLGENAPEIPWPNGAQSLTLQDIDYVVGGRYTQQFISVRNRDDGEAGYYILPVVWHIPQNDTQEGRWTMADSGDWTAPEQDWRRTCAGCHTTNLTLEALESGAAFAFAVDWQSGDVELGVGCEACHGPGGDHGGGVNPMPRTPDAQVCAQCHVQGLDASGMHPFPLTYQPGLPFDDTVFTMTPEDDEMVWWSTGHARVGASQYNEWIESGHATAAITLQSSALAEDWCLRCHTAPPDSTDTEPEAVEQSLMDIQYGVTCVTCHNVHPSDSQPYPALDLWTPDDDKRPQQPLDLSDGKYHTYLPGDALQEGEIADVRFLLQDEPYTLCVGCHNSMTPDGETMLVGETLHHPVQEMFEGYQVVAGVEGLPSTHFTREEGPRCMMCHMPRTATIGEFGRPVSHRLTPAYRIDEHGFTVSGR